MPQQAPLVPVAARKFHQTNLIAKLSSRALEWKVAWEFFRPLKVSLFKASPSSGSLQATAAEGEKHKQASGHQRWFLYKSECPSGADTTSGIKQDESVLNRESSLKADVGSEWQEQTLHCVVSWHKEASQRRRLLCSFWRWQVTRAPARGVERKIQQTQNQSKSEEWIQKVANWLI